MFWKIYSFLLCWLCLPLCESKIICDVETYVLSGIEFARCHQGTMEQFPSTPLNMNPCPALTHLVNSCSEVLRVRTKIPMSQNFYWCGEVNGIIFLFHFWKWNGVGQLLKNKDFGIETERNILWNKIYLWPVIEF
jgi:hypothetical protein